MAAVSLVTLLVSGRPVWYRRSVRCSSRGSRSQAEANWNSQRDTNQLSNHRRAGSDAAQTLFFFLTLQPAVQACYSPAILLILQKHPAATKMFSRLPSGWTSAVSALLSDDTPVWNVIADCFFSFIFISPF